MNRPVCMNHPDREADPDLSELGPPLCPDCAAGAVLPDDDRAVEIGARAIARKVGDWEPDDGPYDLAAVVVAALKAAPDAVLRELLDAGPSQVEVGTWLTTNFGPAPVEHQALVLAEEVGEICRAVAKRAQGIRGSRDEWTAALHQEMADAQIVLLALASAEGVDLEHATATRWAAVTKRDARGQRSPEGASCGAA